MAKLENDKIERFFFTKCLLMDFCFKWKVDFLSVGVKLIQQDTDQPGKRWHGGICNMKDLIKFYEEEIWDEDIITEEEYEWNQIR